LGGLQEKYYLLIQKQTPVYSVVRRLELQKGPDYMVRWSKNYNFLAVNPPDGFGANGDKKYHVHG